MSLPVVPATFRRRHPSVTRVAYRPLLLWRTAVRFPSTSSPRATFSAQGDTKRVLRGGTSTGSTFGGAVSEPWKTSSRRAGSAAARWSQTADVPYVAVASASAGGAAAASEYITCSERDQHGADHAGARAPRPPLGAATPTVTFGCSLPYPHRPLSEKVLILSLTSSSSVCVRVLGGLSAYVDGAPVALPPTPARGSCSPGWRCTPARMRARGSPGCCGPTCRGERAQDAARRGLRAAARVRARRAGGGDARERRAARGRGPGGVPARGPRALERRAGGGLPRAARGRRGWAAGAARPAGGGELLARARLARRGACRARAASTPRASCSPGRSDWALRARRERGVAAARAPPSRCAAIGWTRARIEHEPLGEAAHRDLIRLLALAGDRPAALAAADPLAERLRRELRVPPSPRRARWSRRCGAGASAPPRPRPSSRCPRRSPGPPAPRAARRRCAAARPRGTTPRPARCGSRSRPASPGSARRPCWASSRGASTPRAPRCCSGAATSTGCCPTSRGSRRSSATSTPCRRSSASARSATARSRGCCPRSAAPRRAGDAAGRALPRVRGRPRAARGDRRRAPGAARARRPALGRPRLAAAAPPPRADGARRARAGRDLHAPGGADRRRGRDARRPAPRRPARPARARGLDEDAVAAVLARHERRPATPPPTASAPAATRSSSTSCCATRPSAARRAARRPACAR